jgi:hypothetical protein
MVHCVPINVNAQDSARFLREQPASVPLPCCDVEDVLVNTELESEKVSMYVLEADRTV